MKNKVELLIKRVQAFCLDTKFEFKVEYDQKYALEMPNTEEKYGRLYLQVVYTSGCNKTLLMKEWTGRKYYLSDFMTDDEIIKTAYVAFKTAVEHEIMEGFKVDDIILFNPHINFEELLKISNNEVIRDDKSPLHIV